MSDLGDLLGGIAAVAWVGVAAGALVVFRRVLAERGSLTKLGIGPSGVSMEFAEKKLEEATASRPGSAVGAVARRGVLHRVERNADLLDGARILWVDDHPANNAPIVDLLVSFRAVIETAATNDEALALLASARYDVVISDVGRDAESSWAGLELADRVQRRYGRKILLFTGSVERLDARLVATDIFGVTDRFDEVLHLILDMLERERL